MTKALVVTQSHLCMSITYKCTRPLQKTPIPEAESRNQTKHGLQYSKSVFLFVCFLAQSSEQWHLSEKLICSCKAAQHLQVLSKWPASRENCTKFSLSNITLLEWQHVIVKPHFKWGSQLIIQPLHLRIRKNLRKMFQNWVLIKVVALSYSKNK